MEGKDDHGPATSQLTPLQVDLVDPPEDKLNTLTGKNVAGSEKLRELKKISDYWLVPPNPQAIHIIVEIYLPLGKCWVQWVSEILLAALLSVCYFTTSLLNFSVISVTAGKRPLSSPHPEEPTLKLVRAGYFEKFPAGPPSTLGQPPEFSKIQDNSAVRMFCNRPRMFTSTPITLLHPIFGQFVDDCKNCHTTPELARFALDLATRMCAFYRNEASREQVFRELVYEGLGIKLNAAKVEGTDFTTDGHASIGFHTYINTECRNEIGSTAADPYLQSAIYYHYHAKNSFRTVPNSRFPCLHIYYFGKCSSVSDFSSFSCL